MGKKNSLRYKGAFGYFILEKNWVIQVADIRAKIHYF